MKALSTLRAREPVMRSKVLVYKIIILFLTPVDHPFPKLCPKRKKRYVTAHSQSDTRFNVLSALINVNKRQLDMELINVITFMWI